MLPGHAESVVSQQPAAMVHDELVESPRDDDDDDEEYSESHEASESDNDGNEDDIEWLITIICAAYEQWMYMH